MATSTVRQKSPITVYKEDFYEELRRFKLENGYLLRMLEDGKNVILTDEFKTRLYMTADDAFEVE